MKDGGSQVSAQQRGGSTTRSSLFKQHGGSEHFFCRHSDSWFRESREGRTASIAREGQGCSQRKQGSGTQGHQSGALAHLPAETRPWKLLFHGLQPLPWHRPDLLFYFQKLPERGLARAGAYL